MSTADQTVVWLDGEVLAWQHAHVHVSALGTASASSCFEGIRAYESAADPARRNIFRLAAHLDRLVDSAKILRLPLALSKDELHQACVDLVRTAEDGDIYLRVLLFEQLDEMGTWVGDGPCRVMIAAQPRPSRLGEPVGKSYTVSSWRRLSDDVMPPRVKAIANYLNSRYASLQAESDGYDGALMLDAQGKLTEAATACLFVVRNGAVVVPYVSSSTLEGVTRDSLLAIAADLDIPIEMRPIDRSELYIADEVFVCGTGGGEITPLTAVDRIVVADGGIGPVTSALLDRYEAAVRARDDVHAAWRTEVAR